MVCVDVRDPGGKGVVLMSTPPFVSGPLHVRTPSPKRLDIKLVSGLLGRPLEDGLHASALGLHALVDRAVRMSTTTIAGGEGQRESELSTPGPACRMEGLKAPVAR